MLFYFDKNDLNLNVKLGALETYTVSEDISRLVERIDALKQERDNFIKDIFNPRLKEILDEVEKLNCTANPGLTDIRKS